MSRWRRASGLALLGLLAAELATGESSDAAVSPTTKLNIGVAPFEQVAPAGSSVPDVATLLADRLATQGVERIVGPADLGAQAVAEPSVEQVLGWAEAHDVGTVVVGRSTRFGRTLSVDVRVRSGRDGSVLGTYVEEVARPGEIGAAVERLSEHVLEGASLATGSASRRAAEEAEAAGEEERQPFKSDAPIKIQAAQLEAFESEGRKRLVFTERVRASQGDLTLRAERLEAFYPANSSQPDRLVAEGRVVVAQPNRTARCEKATYFRDDQRVVCSGKEATLTQDDDQVQGKEITFHLDTEVLTVTGGALVRIHPDGEGWDTDREGGAE